MHRLWDHLGSNLSLYLQPQEPHPDGAPKPEPTSDQAERAESHQIEKESEKGNFIKTHGRHHGREWKGLVRNRDDNEVLQNSVADRVNSQDGSHRSVSRTKQSLSPRPTIHKKKRRTEEQKPRKVIFSPSQLICSKNLYIHCTSGNI